MEFEQFQSNHEGALVDKIQESYEWDLAAAPVQQSMTLYAKWEAKK